MKVLVISQYFWPESFRINELVTTMVSHGIDVDVLTGKPNYPEGSVFQEYRSYGCQLEKWDGASIFRVPIVPRGKKGAIRLAVNYFSFIFSASFFGTFLLRKERPDVIFVYAVSPLLQALPALFIAWIKLTPVVVYVQDLWPESLEATGYIRSKFIIGLVEILVKFIYQYSDLILISSRPFKKSIESFSPSAEIVYFPNSVDPSFCDPESGSRPEVPSLNQGFCVVFAGNVGAAQAVHVITEAANYLKAYSDIRIVVIGSGSKIEWMRSKIASDDLKNVFLAGRFPVVAMPYVLSRASVLLVSLTDHPIFAATVPNKIQAYMAVGRPIIASMNGEGAQLVQEANAGLAVPAENGKALAEAILKLYSMPTADREKLGANAQAYYRQHFNHEKLVIELISHLTKVRKVKK